MCGYLVKERKIGLSATTTALPYSLEKLSQEQSSVLRNRVQNLAQTYGKLLDMCKYIFRVQIL